jgi:hypothetical protein
MGNFFIKEPVPRLAAPPPYRLIPLTETLFAVDGYCNFWLEFVLTDGKVTAVARLYDDGRRETSARFARLQDRGRGHQPWTSICFMETLRAIPRSARTSRHSRMASLIFFSASRRVFP